VNSEIKILRGMTHCPRKRKLSVGQYPWAPKIPYPQRCDLLTNVLLLLGSAWAILTYRLKTRGLESRENGRAQ
jgi:hypothetical protein